jgi:hypothetical protein
VRTALVAVALSLGLTLVISCNPEASRFPVVITTLTDDGKPLADLPITLGNIAAGKTDAQGHLKVRVGGKEGKRIAVTVGVPKGYRLVAPEAQLVLRHLNDLENGGRPLPVEHTIRLAPLQRQYAVLVRVGVGGLAVEAFGTRRAITNDQGVALFLYDGAPGDELQVKVDTSAHPELRPQNPTASFLLAQRSDAYVLKEHFTTLKAPPVHKKRPLVPKRL